MTPEAPGPEEATAEPEWQRRKRLAEVFGEVLPDATADDVPDATPEATESPADAWLRAQVPPHHG
jgi:hypothetical protein